MSVSSLEREVLGTHILTNTHTTDAIPSIRLWADTILYNNMCALHVILLFQLIMDELDSMTHHPDLCSVDGHESLSHRIVTLHLVYNQCSTEVLQFSQLVLQRPGILKSLSKVNFISATDWVGKVNIILWYCNWLNK